MKLFSNRRRTDQADKRGEESMYSFLDRCAHTKAAEIRKWLEEWFEEYPNEEKEYLRRELQADSEERYYSALFTLYCHRIFKQHGYVMECHPDIPGETKHPDFLVKKDDVPLFYLECTVSFDPDEEKAKKAILKQIYDLMDPQDHPDFYIGVNLHREALRMPKVRAIRTFLQRNIATLDPDELFECLLKDGWNAMPTFLFTQKGWEIEFRAIPKPKLKRGKHGVRPVDFEMREPQWVDSRKQLFNTMKGKAKRYGELPLPYILAVDSRDIFLDTEDVLGALIGSESWSLDFETKNAIVTRNKDGLLIGPDGPKYTTVSAVLVTWMVNANEPEKTSPVLWINPWARHALDQTLWKGHKRILKDKNGEVERVAGLDVLELL